MPKTVCSRQDAIRVTLQQPALPLYRVPVFQELNARDDLDVHVTYGCVPGLPNAAPVGFRASPTRERRLRCRGRVLLWDSAQWSSCQPKKADVVVLTWNLNYLSLLPALLRARLCGVGAVLWGHGRSIGQTVVRARLRAFAARFADTVICYGRAGAEECIANGVRRANVFVADNALDERPARREMARLAANPKRLASFQRQEGIEGARTILFVSRLHPENRVDLLFDALPAVNAAVPNARVVVVGKGETERRRLEAIARSRGVAERVRFLGPIYDEAELAPWFMSASVLCYPQNVGLSAIHALAYGLPVVCGDDLRHHNPEAEAVVDGRSGRLFRHGDAADLARVLVAVLADDDERRRLSDGAVRMIDERFNVRQMTSVMASAIEAAASRHRRC